jgi:hypothetical protein
MRKLIAANPQYPPVEHIDWRKVTQGTETSKYLEEKKIFS